VAIESSFGHHSNGANPSVKKVFVLVLIDVTNMLKTITNMMFNAKSPHHVGFDNLDLYGT